MSKESAVKAYIMCSACLDGTMTQEWKELEYNSFGEQALVNKSGVNFVSIELEPNHLIDKTIAEIISNKACRKCRSKALTELVR